MNEARLCPIYGNERRRWRCGRGRADGGIPDQWQRARNDDVGVTSPAANDLPYTHEPPTPPPHQPEMVVVAVVMVVVAFR